MTNRIIAAIVVVAATFAVPGCTSSTLSGPSIVSVAGTWAGPMTDSRIGVGSIQVTFAQSGTTLTGTWATTWPAAVNNANGTLAGSISGSTVTSRQTPSNSQTCPVDVTATVNGNQMTGSYVAVNCSENATGTFTLTKQ